MASRIVSVLGGECGLDPTTVSLSEVSDWMEQSSHVIQICGERYTPTHKWSHLRGAAKLWSVSAVRDLSRLGEPWAKIRLNKLRALAPRGLLQALASQQVPRAIMKRPAEWAAGTGNSLPAACKSLFGGCGRFPRGSLAKKKKKWFSAPPLGHRGHKQ